jgi:hypothetical protein
MSSVELKSAPSPNRAAARVCGEDISIITSASERIIGSGAAAN